MARDALEEPQQPAQLGQGQMIEQGVALPLLHPHLVHRDLADPILGQGHVLLNRPADVGQGAGGEALEDPAQVKLGVGRAAGEAGLDVAQRPRHVGKEGVDDGGVGLVRALRAVHEHQPADDAAPRPRLVLGEEQAVGDMGHPGHKDLVGVGLQARSQIAVQGVHAGNLLHEGRVPRAELVEEVIADEVDHPLRAGGDHHAVEDAPALEVDLLGGLLEELGLLGGCAVVQAGGHELLQQAQQLLQLGGLGAEELGEAEQV